MGRALIDAIKVANTKGCAIFLTREYGGVKLGFKRFNIVRTLASQVIPQNGSSAHTSSNAATGTQFSSDMQLKPTLFLN